MEDQEQVVVVTLMMELLEAAMVETVAQEETTGPAVQDKVLQLVSLVNQVELFMPVVAEEDLEVAVKHACLTQMEK